MRPEEFAFLTSFQVKLMLLIREHTLRTHSGQNLICSSSNEWPRLNELGSCRVILFRKYNS